MFTSQIGFNCKSSNCSPKDHNYFKLFMEREVYTQPILELGEVIHASIKGNTINFQASTFGAGRGLGFGDNSLPKCCHYYNYFQKSTSTFGDSVKSGYQANFIFLKSIYESSLKIIKDTHFGTFNTKIKQILIYINFYAGKYLFTYSFSTNQPYEGTSQTQTSGTTVRNVIDEENVNDSTLCGDLKAPKFLGGPSFQNTIGFITQSQERGTTTSLPDGGPNWQRFVSDYGNILDDYFSETKQINSSSSSEQSIIKTVSYYIQRTACETYFYNNPKPTEESQPINDLDFFYTYPLWGIKYEDGQTSQGPSDPSGVFPYLPSLFAYIYNINYDNTDRTSTDTTSGILSTILTSGDTGVDPIYAPTQGSINLYNSYFILGAGIFYYFYPGSLINNDMYINNIQRSAPLVAYPDQSNNMAPILGNRPFFPVPSFWSNNTEAEASNPPWSTYYAYNTIFDPYTFTNQQFFSNYNSTNNNFSYGNSTSNRALTIYDYLYGESSISLTNENKHQYLYPWSNNSNYDLDSTNFNSDIFTMITKGEGGSGPSLDYSKSASFNQGYYTDFYLPQTTQYVQIWYLNGGPQITKNMINYSICNTQLNDLFTYYKTQTASGTDGPIGYSLTSDPTNMVICLLLYFYDGNLNYKSGNGEHPWLENGSNWEQGLFFVYDLFYTLNCIMKIGYHDNYTANLKISQYNGIEGDTTDPESDIFYQLESTNEIYECSGANIDEALILAFLSQTVYPQLQGFVQTFIEGIEEALPTLLTNIGKKLTELETDIIDKEGTIPEIISTLLEDIIGFQGTIIAGIEGIIKELSTAYLYSNILTILAVSLPLLLSNIGDFFQGLIKGLKEISDQSHIAQKIIILELIENIITANGKIQNLINELLSTVIFCIAITELIDILPKFIEIHLPSKIVANLQKLEKKIEDHQPDLNLNISKDIIKDIFCVSIDGTPMSIYKAILEGSYDSRNQRGLCPIIRIELLEDIISNAPCRGNCQISIPPQSCSFTTNQEVLLYSTVPLCFAKGTKILTNVGPVEIQKINTRIHTTYNGRPIKAITKTYHTENYLIEIKTNALGNNCPIETTYITGDHLIMYRKRLVKPVKLIHLPGIKKIIYNKELVYNVLLEKHGLILANNILCESLDPEHPLAKVYLEKNNLNICELDDQIKIIEKNSQKNININSVEIPEDIKNVPTINRLSKFKKHQLDELKFKFNVKRFR